MGCSLHTSGEQPGDGWPHSDGDGSGEVRLDGDGPADDASDAPWEAEAPADATDEAAGPDADGPDSGEDEGGDTPCPPGVPEICNGIDDNCDGFTDEGFPCSAGAIDGCMDTVCGLGLIHCSADCNWDPCEPFGGECSPQGITEPCVDALCGPGARTCQMDCTWGICEGLTPWECFTAGATRSCMAGACPGVERCGADCRWAPCAASCAAGLTCCSTGCADTSSDNNNCGGCEHRCPAGTECQDATCESTG